MSKTNIFIAIETALIIASAIVIFKKFRYFFQCLFSFLFSGYYVFWKKLRDEHFDRSMKFTFYLIIVFVLSVINLVIFRYFI